MRAGDLVVHEPTGDTGTIMALLGDRVAIAARNTGKGDPVIVVPPGEFTCTFECDDRFHVSMLQAIVAEGDRPGLAGTVYMLCETALLDILEAKRKVVRVRPVTYTRFERVPRKRKGERT